MIKGYFFQPHGRPHFAAQVYFPRLQVSGLVAFLFDTGADNSMMGPPDATKLGVDYQKLGNPRVAYGIGGSCKSFCEPAQVTFASKAAVFQFDIEIEIAEYNPTTKTLPSLLGRNIIDQWQVNYDPHNDTLKANVRTATATKPVTRGT